MKMEKEMEKARALCVRARPEDRARARGPGASYMVSVMSAANWRTSSVISVTGAHFSASDRICHNVKYHAENPR